MTDEMREAFKSWARLGSDPYDVTEIGIGVFHSGNTQNAWYGWQAALSSLTLQDLMQVDEMRKLVDATKKAYDMLVQANLAKEPHENQRCGRCDYCELLLSNADDDDCGECYSIIEALAPFVEASNG